MDFDGLEQASLQNYDDAANDFDDETFSSFKGKPGGTPRVKRSASFDLSFVNASGEALYVELFNNLNSFLKKKRLDIITSATVTMIPQLTREGLVAAGVGVVGIDSLGRLFLSGAASATALTVDCPQLSYASLLQASEQMPFTIKAIRMTVTTDAQIDNEIVHFTKSFLGSSSQNTISPRTSFRPDQFQGKIIDIPLDFRIDGQKGITYKVNAGETVKWNVLIER